MEFNKVLESRKSIRRYEPCEISESELKEMVKAAGMVPSSDNVQNWHFAAINDREIIRTIGRIAREKWQKAFDIYKDTDPEKGEKTGRRNLYNDLSSSGLIRSGCIT